MAPILPRQAGAALGDQPLAVQEAVRAYLEQVAQQVSVLGSPTAVQTETYRAKAGDLVLVDPTNGAFTVWLPEITRQTLGKFVRVHNASSSNVAVTIQPSNADETIDGNTSLTMDYERGGTLLVAATPDLWVEAFNNRRALADLWDLWNELQDDSLVGRDVYWDDIRVPLSAGKTGASNPPTFSQFKDDGSGSVGVFNWAFAYQAVVGNEEQMWFAAQLPHSYKLGTDLDAHIHWTPAVSGGSGEFVKWGLEYTIVDVDGTFSDTTIATSDASGASTATTSGDSTLTAGKHYYTDITDIDGSGISGVSAMIVCRIFRNSSHADDTLNQDAFAFEVDFHFEVDSLGSRQETVK